MTAKKELYWYDTAFTLIIHKWFLCFLHLFFRAH